MTRKCLSVLVSLVLLTGAAFAVGGAEDDGETVYRIGYIQGGADAYYQMQADAARLVVDYMNENEPYTVEFNVFFHEGRPERELSIVEDFIAQQMDAIVVFTSAAEAAQREAQLANEAEIPFFVVGSTPADGPGRVTSNIKGDPSLDALAGTPGICINAHDEHPSSGRIQIPVWRSGQDLRELPHGPAYVVPA